MHSLRCAVIATAVLGATTSLGAQTTPRMPTGSPPIVKPTVTAQGVDKIDVSKSGRGPVLTAPPPFAQSLMVSLDGQRWGHAVTVNYTNACSHGPPSSCGITPPHTTIYLSWNPSIPPAQMSLEAVNSYYMLDVTPFGDTCWDVTKIAYISGDQSTSRFTFGGPSPNAAQSYTCTYQIDAKANQNGTLQTVATNSVTVNVNITQAAH